MATKPLLGQITKDLASFEKLSEDERASLLRDIYLHKQADDRYFTSRNGPFSINARQPGKSAA